MNIENLRLDQIEVGERLRGVDCAHVELIAASFREVGQRTPIDVRRVDGKYRLVTGAHRLAAAPLAEFRTIAAQVIDVDNTDAEIIEIDENLMRADLSALDRAVFLARRKVLYLAKNPPKPRGHKSLKSRIGNFSDARADRFSAAMAKRLGVSESSLDKALTLANRIPVEVRRRLTGTIFADNAVELRVLSGLIGAEKQMAALDLVLNEGAPLKTIRAARDKIEGRLVDERENAEEKAFDAFLKNWHLYARFRQRVIAHVQHKAAKS